MVGARDEAQSPEHRSGSTVGHGGLRTVREPECYGAFFWPRVLAAAGQMLGASERRVSITFIYHTALPMSG